MTEPPGHDIGSCREDLSFRRDDPRLTAEGRGPSRAGPRGIPPDAGARYAISDPGRAN